MSPVAVSLPDAPSVESDGESLSQRSIAFRSVHAPCGERPVSVGVPSRASMFQSTLPVWGATCCSDLDRQDAAVSIHAPRVGSDPYTLRYVPLVKSVSIHAPRVGSDSGSARTTPILPVSIHAPRVGSDQLRRQPRRRHP